MGKYEDFYQKLRQDYTDEEIVDSNFISADLTEEEWEESNKVFREARLEMLRRMTKEDKINLEVLRLRFLIEDYSKGEFDPQKDFGYYLKEYIRITEKAKKAIAADLDIHNTRLSRILNGKEEPNVAMAYRLQEHSGDLIPAIVWWKLWIKKQEYELLQDLQKRQEEIARVSNSLRKSA